MIQSSSSQLHVAIIMDGNGRWAAARGLPRVAGHRAGADSVRRVVEAAPKLGISVLTLYAFSSDNWRRPPREVAALMRLLRNYLLRETDHAKKEGVRISFIGRRDRLPQSLTPLIEHAEQATAHCRRLHLRLAVDYSSRDAILDAARQAAAAGDLSRESFSRRLGPDVDLAVRTSGEQRLSDFLLWEVAYAELYFTPRQWPDFDAADLAAALAAYHARERRFGALPPARKTA